MSVFNVEFSLTADEELFEAYVWGMLNWGDVAAQRWAREIRDTIAAKLTRFPRRHPIAQEASEQGIEIRQMIVGRYRILFTIDKETLWSCILVDPTPENEHN